MLSDDTISSGKRPVFAVTRAIAILRLIAVFPMLVGVVPLARKRRLVASTRLHILREFQNEGIVKFDSKTKHSSIGAGILAQVRTAMLRDERNDIGGAGVRGERVDELLDHAHRQHGASVDQEILRPVQEMQVFNNQIQNMSIDAAR